MGFGINETIYDGSENLENALTAMKIVVDIQAVKESTIVSPHIFGPQVVGMSLCPPATLKRIFGCPQRQMFSSNALEVLCWPFSGCTAV